MLPEDGQVERGLMLTQPGRFAKLIVPERGWVDCV